jgi:TonB family protein
MGFGGGKIGGSGRKGGSKYGWYAGKVQTAIADALRSNDATRSAVMSIQVKIWADATGRVSKAQLVSSTGNPEIDSALRNEVLRGLRLPEPPPADMPMPINLRISARKP